MFMNLYADGNTSGHMNESLKSTTISTISQEASTVTHNPNVHSLTVGSFRKFSQSQGTSCSYVYIKVKDKNNSVPHVINSMCSKFPMYMQLFHIMYLHTWDNQKLLILFQNIHLRNTFVV